MTTPESLVAAPPKLPDAFAMTWSGPPIRGNFLSSLCVKTPSDWLSCNQKRPAASSVAVITLALDSSICRTETTCLPSDTPMYATFLPSGDNSGNPQYDRLSEFEV